LLKKYYNLTKPGIIYGNALTTIAGYALASITRQHINLTAFGGVLIGTVLVIASGCVFNNYLDRNIDKIMKRTKKRALVQGTISSRNALLFASILGLLGFATLALWTNWLTFAVGAVGFIDYVILYGWAKRKTVYGTIVGSISGATPPLAGYTAVANHLDAGGILFFLVLVCWQMPHFYAIAMYRAKDYAAANIPVLPVKKGMHAAKTSILLYIVAFVIVSGLLTVYGYTGIIYLVLMSALGVIWFYKGLVGFRTQDDVTWGKRMFLFSLVVNMAFCLLIPLGAWLP
jgi:heme o synthase